MKVQVRMNIDDTQLYEVLRYLTNEQGTAVTVLSIYKEENLGETSVRGEKQE